MFQYVDNRVLCLGGSLPRVLDEARVAGALVDARLDDVLEATTIDGPVHERSSRGGAIALRLRPAGIDRLQCTIRNHTSVMTLVHGVLRIIPPGFVDAIAIYDVDDDTPLREVEALGDIMAELADALLPTLQRLLHALEAAGVVTPSSVGWLGVPSSLAARGLHGPEQAYTYNQHLVYARPEAFEAAVTELGARGHRFAHDGHAIVMSWAISLWKVEGPPPIEAIVDLLAMDTLGLMESVTIDNATACNTAFLGLAARRTLPSAAELRAVYVEHNHLLTTLALLRRRLEDGERHYLEVYAEQSFFADKHALLRRTEEAVRFAVEGLERDATDRSQRTIQRILAVLTVITLYSVGNDVLGILNATSISGFTVVSTTTLACVSLVMLALLWTFFRHTRGR